MTGPSAARTIITYGWAISLLVVSAAALPAAWACPIVIERLDGIPAASFVISVVKNNRDEHDQDEPPQSATVNKLNPLFGVGAVEFHSGSEPISPQSAAVIAGFRPNSAADSGRAPPQHGTDDEDVTSVQDVAVALYRTIYDVNSDVAGDLLTSYRAISRVRRDIIAAIEVPLNAVGVSNLTTVSVVPSALADDDRYDDSFRKSDLDRLISRLQHLFSLDALPYYLCIFGVYVVFVAFRATVRATSRSRHSARHSYRDRA